MKKNITINLLGRLYAIDEDAYELLKQYTDSLRSYFGRREGGEEIADDIESRIAELFDELKQSGQEAITIEHVQDIIHRVGRPEEMEETPETPSDSPCEGENCATDTPPSQGGAGGGSKRLYRNLADKKFMGVLSGLAAYFGGDVLWWRLGYMALFIFTPGGFVNHIWSWGYWNTTRWGAEINTILFFAYIALGLLMPVAETPEDRLRMKGKKVTPQNLADELSQPQPQPADSGHLGCLGGFFFILGTLARWAIYAVGIGLVFVMLAGIVGVIAVMTMPHTMIHESDPLFWQFFDANRTYLQATALTCLCALLIPTYCIIHSLFCEFRLLRPMSFRQRLTCILSALLCFIVAASFCTGLVGKIKEAEEQSHKIHQEQWRKENTHDGILYNHPDEWDFLSERGWRVLRADHCDRFTARGEYYTGSDARYIDTFHPRHLQLFTIERTESLQPGRYRLTACVRADGQGAYIYAYTDSLTAEHAPYLAEIPADGNTGGNIWAEAKEYLERKQKEHGDTVYDMDTFQRMFDIAHPNNGQGYGWNRIALSDIQVTRPSVLHYGLSTVPALTGRTFLGRWFSACDFELTRVDDKEK